MLSKMDQSGKGKWIWLNRFLDLDLCPVESLSRFLDVRVVGVGALLCHEDLYPLTEFQFSTILKRCLVALGLEDFNVSDHSFQIGTATEAAQLDLDDETGSLGFQTV